MSTQGFVKLLKARRAEINAMLASEPDHPLKAKMNRELKAISEKLMLATREKING